VIRFLVGEQERRVQPPAGVEVEQTAPGRFVWRQGTRVEVFHCVRDGDDVHLSWRGRSYRFEVLREGRRSAHRHAGGGLEAPMPGTVTAVKAREGQAVQKGEEILVVEAMKMENAIRAPRAGSVRRITVAVGDMVAPGQVLAEIE
jgi:biotin carboxyl carrier protein